ncbi:hypothetical protein FIU97_05430 [Roseivivax sp. THAF40]|uniref:hypothetical protein n=1 Tax=unclassified Roseivivax TaxID=2639302 RepID=UPI0012683328|nr:MULTISPECIES: hypothetical protein [unclassified Roseivivax]QFS82215.1 hypothetical protein FIV09_05170 [Roseivivax sp. THAF197b]QFT46015.1 hypothetical protein FIU97_05430 [Roseivivax sp. THAF40]
MSNDLSNKPSLRCRIAQVGVLLSCMPILGWMLDTPWLVRASETHAAIVLPTAFSFTLVFIALMLIERGRAEKLQRTLIFAVIGLVIAEQLYPDLHALPSIIGVARAMPAAIDGMSAATAIGFLLTALVLWRLQTNRDSTIALAVSLFGLSSAVAILLGHSFEPASIYALPVFAELSQYTAALFALFFATTLIPESEGALTPPV